MQFSILLIGALLFAFFALKPAPVYFNEHSFNLLEAKYPQEAAKLSQEHHRLQQKQLLLSRELLEKRDQSSENAANVTLNAYKSNQQKIKQLHQQVEETINEKKISFEKTDTNYIFLYFVRNTLPVGLI